MCFSASASFGAGIVLSAVGIASIKKAQSTSQIAFASIPLIFSAQQITEGLLWLALSSSTFNSLQNVTTYIFLFIAQVIWPIAVPLAILLLDKKGNRKIIQKILVGIGAIVSIYLAYCLLSFNVEAKIIGYHISYEQDYPKALARYGGIFYIIATVAPSIFSGIKKMWLLGTTILISYIITTIFYVDYIVSVWCFFASVISVTIFIIIHGLQRSDQLVSVTVKK
jgi:hypothetical protein